MTPGAPAAVSFARVDDVLHACSRASSVALSAYTLAPHGAMVRALEAAADRGARVDVTLEGFAERSDARDLRRAAVANARELRAHGVGVRLGAPAGSGEVHLKAAVVDGTAFLDDRNWAARGGETIVATTRRDEVAAVRDAIVGRPHAAGNLATDKRSALALEAAAVTAGGDRIDLETESFGPGAVAAALRARATAGAHVRLLVNGHVAGEPGGRRERALLRELARAGVEIRASPAGEKLCVAGDRGWVGSANATAAAEPMTDWGLAVDDPKLLETLGTTFERNWNVGRPWR